MEHALRFLLLLSLAAMFADITYEGARGIVGPFAGVLGASPVTIGLVAGLGELLGFALRPLTGWLADRTQRYFLLTTIGYGLTFVAVAGLALAQHPTHALLLLLLERLAKSIRSPARSVLVSQATQQMGHGKGFALDEALDQLGAITGPLLCALVMSHAADHSSAADRYRLAFSVLAIPATGNLLLLLLARRLHRRSKSADPTSPRVQTQPGSGSHGLVPALRWYLAGAALLAFGTLDWALISAHLASPAAAAPGGSSLLAGMAPQHLAMLYALAMAADGVAALMVGSWFDRLPGGKGVLALLPSPVLALAAAACLFGMPLDRQTLWVPRFLDLPGWLLLGVGLWGGALGVQETICKAAIARFVPAAQRARAYGLFFGLFGLSWWLGSLAVALAYQQRPSWVLWLSALALAPGACLVALSAVRLIRPGSPSPST